MIVDAHLDLSYNAWNGRPVERPAREQPADDDGIPTVGLPDLRQGRVDLVCATIFCQPESAEHPGYRDGDEAHDAMMSQLDWYRRQIDAGEMQFVRALGDVRDDREPHPRAILLLEGADGLRNDSDAAKMFDAGLRIVGLAWKRTRHAGGTGEPGPLTDEGLQLVKSLDRLGIIHDTSHLAEQSFWNLLDKTTGPVMASHSNCRVIVPTDRQLSDDMIRAIGARDGIIGINFFDKFLLPPEIYGKRRAKLSDVVTHIGHMCDRLGDARHVGLGTDMDGGLGKEQIPVEIETSADLSRVGDALSAANFSDTDIAGILSENWLRFFEKNLPRG